MSTDVSRTEEQHVPRFRPASDIVEREDGFHIIMDMPGVQKEALFVDVNKNEVTVSARTSYPAEPPKPEKAGDRSYTHVEFGGGEYRRTFTLSDSVDREKITAILKNGVLDLYLPKSEAAKPRRIEISAG